MKGQTEGNRVGAKQGEERETERYLIERRRDWECKGGRGGESWRGWESGEGYIALGAWHVELAQNDQ